MNKCYIDVSFPKNGDKTHAILSFNAMKIGNALFLAHNGPRVQIGFSYDVAQNAFDTLIKYSDIKRANQEHPYPESITFVTDEGPVSFDSHLIEEMVGAFAVIIAENEIGDLLAMYPPD